MNFSNLSLFLDSLMQKGVPGVDCVVYVKNKPVFRHSAGYSDVKNKVAVKQDELYNLYSATKVITCTAALQLYERGLYLLNDPLYAYLPEFKEMTVKHITENYNVEYAPAKTPIKISDLFTMCAGLTYDLSSASIKAIQASTQGKCPTRETVKAFSKEPLIFEPGTHWNYSLCHDVLGALIEVLSGEKLGEYLKKNIFEPVGMKETGFTIPADKVNRMAHQYIFMDDTQIADEISIENGYKLGSEYESGGAGLISSVDDYILFADSLCNGGNTASGENILSRHTIDLMRTNHLDSTCLKDYSVNHRVGYGYGLGVRTMIDKVNGGCNGNNGEFAWGGAAGAYVLIDPENELTIYYAQHMLNAMSDYIHPRIRNITYACLDK